MPLETIHQLEPLMNSEAVFAGLKIAGVRLDLDLTNRHERSYFIQRAFNIKYPQSDIDRMLFLALIKPGDDVLDIGANIGVTACEALEAGAQSVVCFEPEPRLAARLHKITDNRIEVREMAVGAASGKCSLYISASHNQGHTIKADTVGMFPTVFGENVTKCDVPLGTLDEQFPERRFHVWKIDAEGAEPDIIQGARSHLERGAPRAIICELYGDLPEVLIRLLHPTHPYAYRAFITKNDYRLTYTPPFREPDDEVFATSPMFVFSSEPIIVT